jgi:drug/metabolite transporter (DMT)-like permease
MTRRGWVLFLALGVIWGTPYFLIKTAVREVSPALLVFIRTGGGALLLAPVAAVQGNLRPVLARWRPLVIFSAVEIAVPWYLLFNAEKRLPSSLAGLLIASVPIMGAVLAQVTGTDRLDRRRVAGLVLGLGGVVALVGLDVAHSDLVAALSLVVVAAGYALGPWILAQYLSDLSGIAVMAGSLMVCAVVYAPIAAFALPSRALSESVVASIVTLTVVCTAVAFMGMFLLVGEVGAMRATVITYVNPAVAVLLGVTVLGERVNVGTGLGFVLILGGSFLATKPLREPKETPPGPLAAPGHV